MAQRRSLVAGSARLRLRGNLTATVAAALLALVSGAMTAVPATASAKPVRHARDLPALKSDPAPVVAPQRPTGDFRNAPPDPKDLDSVRAAPKSSAFDPARSTPVDAETTATQKVFNNPDGSRTRQTSPTPVRFRDASGTWRDIDPVLTPASDGTLGPKAAAQRARVSPSADATVAELATPAGPIGLRHPDAAAVPAAIAERRAHYPGALGGRDLTVAATASGLEESVTLPDARAPTSYLDLFTLPPGVSARSAAAGGGVEFVDGSGAVLAIFSPGMAYDSAGPAGSPGAVTSVSVRLLQNTPATGLAVPLLRA